LIGRVLIRIAGFEYTDSQNKKKIFSILFRVFVIITVVVVVVVVVVC